MDLLKCKCIYLASALLMAGCVSLPGLPQQAGQHLVTLPAASPDIPPLAPLLPTPKPLPRQSGETYSIVVSDLPVQELLFVLARDAKLNADIHPGISGRVTLNAISKPVEWILERIANQTEIRWKLENGTLSVVPDTPFLKTYRLDYFNLARSIKTHTGIANSVSPTGKTGLASGHNSSATEIISSSQHDFWKTLEKNLRDLLQDEDKLVTRRVASGEISATSQTDAVKALVSALKNTGEEATSRTTDNTPTDKKENTLREGREANDVIVHGETGIIMVRASQKKHAKVAEFLTQVGAAAQRQVMIEATVVEVALSDRYQAGIDWNRIAGGGNWFATQALTGSALSGTAGPLGLVGFDNGSFNATLRLLEQFGRMRVLSSPRIMALNNQTAVMKVVDEQVYFRLSIEEDKNDSGIVTNRTYTSELHTVPVGLVMQVTPQIGESGLITLNVRPTITNVSSYVEDPAVAILSASGGLGVKSLVPNLQVREFDSTLKIPSGQIAMLGGLIQDKLSNQRIGVPGLSRLPLIGDLFSYRDDSVQKIELVVFMRPLAIGHDGLAMDQSRLSALLPGQDFFESKQDHALSAWRSGNLPLMQGGIQP